MKKKVKRVVIIADDKKLSIKPNIVIDDLEVYRRSVKELLNADMVLVDYEDIPA